MHDAFDIKRVYRGTITQPVSKTSPAVDGLFSETLSVQVSKDQAFDKAVGFVLKNNRGYVAGDNPMKFGIMQSTLKDYDPKGKIAGDVSQLNEEKAKQVYRKIWDRAGCDSLSYPLNVIHFDTYVQRPRTGTDVLKQANGDPDAYLEIRKSLLSGIKSYSTYRTQWNSRIDQLAAYVKTTTPAVTEQAVAAAPQQGQSTGRTEQSASTGGLSVFETATRFILRQEGSRMIPNDNGKGPSKYGILQSTLQDYDPRGKIAKNVSELTEDKARKIYRKIWERAGCGDMPYPLSIIHFDTFLHRPRTAQTALETSDGDPEAYLQARQTSLKGLKSYRKYAATWENRIQKLTQFLVRTLDQKG